MTLEERNAIAAYIEARLHAHRRNGIAPPTPAQIKKDLIEIVTETVRDELQIEFDPNEPGAFIITAPIEMVEQLERLPPFPEDGPPEWFEAWMDGHPPTTPPRE